MSVTCNPPYTSEDSIACRGDLNDPNGTYAIGFVCNHLPFFVLFAFSAFRLITVPHRCGCVLCCRAFAYRNHCATDAKITSSALMQSLSAMVIRSVSLILTLHACV